MLRRMLRLLAVVAIAVVALIAIGLLVLHTNPVQGRILDWSIRELERRFDLDLTAEDLHYNLATRHVTMTDVRLAAVGHRDNPFFTADAVTVQLPWAAFRGQLRFDEIGIDSGQVSITRDAQGVSNLPPGRGARDPNAPARHIDIRGLDISNLDFVYRDAQRDIEIRTPQIRTDLSWNGEGAAGAIEIQGDTLIRVRDRRVTIDPISGEMVFDGSNVALEDVDLDTTDGEFVLNGDISRALDRPTLDLTFKGTTELAQSSRWASPPITVAGQANIDAQMTGPPSQFELDARVSASSATVGAADDVAIDARAELTPDRLRVSQFTVRPATGGELHATVDLPFAEDERWWVKANYSGIDAATAFRLAEVDPLALGGSLSGTALLTREPGEPFRLEVHNTSAPRRVPGTAPLEGEVVFVVDGGRWRAEQDHSIETTRVTGNIGGVWNRQRVTESTFDGTLDVTTGDVGQAARYAALFGLVAPEIVQNADGPITADVRMGGTFTEPSFAGTLRSPGVRLPSIGTAALSADFEASERMVGGSNIDATIGSTTVHGDVRANLVTRRLEGELKLKSPNAADLLSQLPEALRLEGPLAATASFAGTIDAPSIMADVSGSELTLGGQPVASLSADVRLLDDRLNVEKLVLQQPGGGELNASGRYDLGDRTFAADITGKGVTWRGPLARLGDAEVQAAVEFHGGGSLERPIGEGVVDFTITGGTAGELIDRGVATVRLNGEAALVTAHVPSLGAFINANVVPREPFTYEAVIVMSRIPLEPVLRLAGLDARALSGNASLSALASGALTDLVNSQVFINLQEIDATASEVPLRLVTPARLAWDGDALTIDALDLEVGQGRLLASGRLGEGGVNTAEWQSTFNGQLDGLVSIGRAFGVPPELEAHGPITFEWRSTGGLDESTAKMHLDGGSVAWGALPAVRDLMLDATFNGTTLNVTQFTGRWQDGGVEGTASIPRAVFESPGVNGSALSPDQTGFAKLRIAGVTEEALSPWLRPETLTAIDGRLSATLDARITSASLAGVDGTLVVDEADFTIAGVSVQQEQAAIFELDGGVVTPRDVTVVAGGSPLTLTGTARLAPVDQQQLKLDLRGTADLQILSAFAPTVATGGEAEIDIGIGGTPSAPVFNGEIAIAGAEVAIREPRIVISELNGTIAMDGQRVVFDAFQGSANGGQLILDGGFLLEGFSPAEGGLTVVLDSAAFEYPAGLQSEANAIVTIRPGPTGWSLVGDINIERSAYTETISLAGLVAARGPRAPATGAGETWRDELRLNLWVTTLADIVVDNNYGRFEAIAALRVIGTAAEPVLAGRVTLNEGGEIYLAGNTFYIERGSISFTNPFRIVPEFDIQLRTLVSGNDITLTIDGPLERLRTEVRSSDPTVDSREAMAMLFGGLQGEDAITLLSTELLGATGRVIGLDTLRVERGYSLDEFRADPGLVATETDPSTRLTLSKRLRPDVELILSQSLRESGGLTAIVSYKPRRNIEVRAVSRDNNDRAMALRHEITFGGAGTAETAASDEGPRVTVVTVAGNPQRPDAELVAELELDPGEEFNFHEWQSDIDRLREIYYAANHYEVRVRGRREVSEDGRTVALEYDIEPGPVSELVIEGHPLDAGVQNEIRQAWRRTIFDRFLLEDIRARIQRHLISEDIIGSNVDAEIAVSTPQTKQIRVTVSAGASVSSRDVGYSGNVSYDADRLDRVIENAGLWVDGWIDPSRIADALDDFYRSQGFLSVRVEASAPRVAGDAGVLPVSIIEGPRFVVGGVTYPGVSPQRLNEVAAAVRLDSGMPFVTAELETARERIEELYAGEGFNTAQIEVNSEPDEERDVVDVAFAVREGPQQILREVTISGATRTDSDVVQRALHLRIGEPVNLADWSQARKRLYDTNVFRQVDIEPVPLDPSTADSAVGIQPVRAAIRVVEYPVWRLRYGAQVTDERAEVPDPTGDMRIQALGVLADLQNQNLFGRAITAGIAGRYERDRQAGSLFTSNSSFLGLPIRSSGFVFTSRQRFVSEAFETMDQRTGITGEQRWRPFRLSEVIWSFRFERSRTFDPDPSPIDPIPLDIVVKVSRLNIGMFFDRRDDPTDPKEGWFNSANYEQAIRALGSDYGNAKLLFQQSAYVGLKRLVLAGRAQFGSAFGEEALIVSERFLLGGATTVRGYAENSLGPQELFGLPGGGDALLNFNGEVRFPVRGWVQGVAFVDAGNVYETRSDLSLSDLFVGYGIGLRLASPFAMLRVDFGIPARTLTAERPANRWGSGRWYFGVGHIF